MQIENGKLNVIRPYTAGSHTVNFQLVSKDKIRVTKMSSLEVNVKTLATTTGINLSLRWDNTTMESGGLFFLDYDREVIFGRTVEPYIDIRSLITINTNLATITNIDNTRITGTIYEGYEGQDITVTVQNTNKIVTATRNRPLSLRGGSFTFKVLDSNETPITSFEGSCYRTMIDNFFSKNTAEEVDRFYLKMASDGY